MSCRSTPYSNASSFYYSMQNWSNFHGKFNDLYMVKMQAATQLRELNRLKLTYIEWFQRLRQTFLDSVKTVQAVMPSMVPQEINTMSQYRQLQDMGHKLRNCGYYVGNLDRIDQFLVFWDDFGEMIRLLDKMYFELNDFCNSITRLRQPEVKEEIDHLYSRMTQQFSDYFDFRDAHNERQNLYTYKLMVSDQRFLGLVGYIPYLLNYATRICYLVRRIHIEKE